jgi:hypothetical protein
MRHFRPKTDKDLPTLDQDKKKLAKVLDQDQRSTRLLHNAVGEFGLKCGVSLSDFGPNFDMSQSDPGLNFGMS